MSRRKLKAREKRSLKNTRDGLVERNAVTGEDIKVTGHEAEADLRGGRQEAQTHFSQVGKSSCVTQATTATHKRQQRQYRQNKQDTPEAAQDTRENASPEQSRVSTEPDSQAPIVNLSGHDNRAAEQEQSVSRTPDTAVSSQHPKPQLPPNRHKRYTPIKDNIAIAPENPAVQDNSAPRDSSVGDKSAEVLWPSPPLKEDKSKSALRTDTQSALNFEPANSASIQANKRKQRRPQTAMRETDKADIRPVGVTVPAKQTVSTTAEQTELEAQTSRSPLTEHRDSPLQQETADKLKFAENGVAPVNPANETKPKTKPQVKIEPDALPGIAAVTEPIAEQPNAPPSEAAPQNSQMSTADTPLKQSKPPKLRFGKDETVPSVPTHAETKQARKYSKAQKQADKSVKKLETAKSKLPAKKKLRTTVVISEETAKPKRKLYFESEVKPQGEHLKGTLPLRPAKAAGNLTIVHAHRKLYQVQGENVGTEAAHKGEILAEGGIRSALRFAKTAPYRKIEKLQRKAAKKSVNLAYQKALAENPKLKSNILSRAFQKRKIKKEYAKAAREAQKAAKQAKKAGGAIADASKALAGAVKRHPMAATIIVLIALLMFALMSLVGAFGGLGSGGLGGILSASYLAEDADIDNAELHYTEWETDLQEQIANAETTHSGYDEYRYNVGDISHNPYELMAYLTIKYQNFSYTAIQADLQALFTEQYTLTFTPTTETRYADPSDADEDDDYEPYDWHILTVTLTARNFSDVIASHLSGEVENGDTPNPGAHYAVLMQTKGARQYLANPFGDLNWLPYVTSYYGYRIHPTGGVKDIHRGIDIGLPPGTEIRSGQDGAVTFAGWSDSYGNYVVIDDGNGLVSKYAHCDSLNVTTGQSVKIGDVIGTVGNTGNSTGAHLHLEILRNGVYLNPAFFVDSGSLNPTRNYGDPGTPMGDGTYAALIAEAERHLGKPYIFGASGPDSFDCSGLICYVYRNAGVYDFGRIGANAIYNACTPVSPSDARPGDVVTFHSTYSAPNPVTHIGIFVGYVNGRPIMLHSGSPCQYAYIDTPYWQQHFYGFARIPE